MKSNQPDSRGGGAPLATASAASAIVATTLDAWPGMLREHVMNMDAGDEARSQNDHEPRTCQAQLRERRRARAVPFA